MKFIIGNIKVPIDKRVFDGYDERAKENAGKILKKAGLAFDAQKGLQMCRKSVDARKKNAIVFDYSFSFESEECPFDTSKFDALNIRRSSSEIPTPIFGEDECKTRPVVVGFGPCGMFCALMLARYGYRPIIVERGSMIEKREKDVENYWTRFLLDTESNVQFGEGGAGTFSDGKLLTRINDPFCAFVIDTFVSHGAPPEILFSAKPHIGTDNLKKIVKSIREEIISLGGSFMFDTKFLSFSASSSGKVTSVSLSGGKSVETSDIFLCIGHSARDTFAKLMSENVEMIPKAFSVGARIEHLQSMIDKSLYGEFAGHPALFHGEYSLSARFGERAVYSFCMCPGGTVVASSSENGAIVTNGMSNCARDGKNANSALAVSVCEKDFGSSVSGAIEFQRNIEKRAYELCDGAAPIATLGNFLHSGKRGITSVFPTYTGKTKEESMDSVFPPFVCENLRAAFPLFEKRIEHFSDGGAILTAPETRTSSPVRMIRDKDTLMSQRFSGLYPCGEGAGYAGGITSAAVDGIRAALAFMKKYKAK